ncbi:diacylglycerol kinase [Salisediminibacterium halotolerans]|uniref:Diacylglycerol kinase (ATP) n=1 Tax=Salisediminibacterium halotolerans TaxID=517425 RepID=A0A1H9VVJ9_9BACI|nr:MULTISPECIES: diacylglycerol kinase [Salisediminibacterium]RLJ71783.1 diacylglycerol kinase [Actinophytocola xinjiangensis]RPE86933.1 diacylglycerol kinase [Salisediminibacterium halotolerans]TWG32996.1 diacylglycerol kinase [Salisediminibacterium halotolerans]SES25776.1 diacylglycerol kinase (ATP) [Salisediminibacterium haloalkalitolerans]GEL08533.1 diacylglycerol kinase [Salisediminibacterium halotolerans]
MTAKRARLIYNPKSGREQVKKHLPYILNAFEEAGYETSAHATKGEDCAVKAAAAACDDHYDLIIAAGGDGTINEVVRGMAEKPHRPKLTILPGGTTNDFARALHIAKDLPTACDQLTKGKTLPVDIGKIGAEYFINIAGGGTLTELTYEVPGRLKTMLGQLAYYIKGIEKLPRIRPTEVVIDYDGERFEGEIMLFLIANTNSVGGNEKLAPNARINDGYFDMILVKKTNLADVVRLAGAALRGEHLDDPRVLYRQAKRIDVSAASEMLLNVDGEYGGKLPGEFINLHAHIDMIIPDIDLPCVADHE